jgi:phosphoglycerol transferase MdoB-like AlkP superfamily enzyme
LLKQAFSFPFRLATFWFLFFAVFRLWFVLSFTHEWSAEHPYAIWESFWYALPLDGSMIGYLVALPVLCWFAGAGVGKRSYVFFNRVINTINLFLIAALVLILGGNVFIYREWHTLLNSRAIAYLSTPSALFDSISIAFTIGLVVLFLTALAGFAYIYQKWVQKDHFREGNSWKNLVILPIWLAVLALGIRGGTGTMPINESAVYYSSHLFNNHAATNPCWYLIHSFLEVRSPKNNYTAVKAEDLPAFSARLLAPTDTLPFPSVFDSSSTTPPNVVFIVMESMTAQVIEELGGEPGVCPQLSRLIKEGVLFDQCYSSGYRTDQGLVSVLAGFPAQPDQSVVLQSEKAAKLNAISKVLKEKGGYTTSFFYGGELTFANIGVWLTNERFDHIFSEKDLSSSEKTQRWGADDRLLLQRAAGAINQLKPPFFATALTLSLHPPFDVPFQSRWTGSTIKEQFLNSAAFADDAIGTFFNTVEKEPWFANTIFMLVADHGSSYPNGLGLDNPTARHIPLIVYSPLLKKEWQGRRISRYCHSHDIPATILAGVNRDWLVQSDFPWSRNLWAVPRPDQNFAYYTNENGLGWMTPEAKVFYRFSDQQWQVFQDTLPEQRRMDARVYLQMVYEAFLGL